MYSLNPEKLPLCFRMENETGHLALTEWAAKISLVAAGKVCFVSEVSVLQIFLAAGQANRLLGGGVPSAKVSYLLSRIYCRKIALILLVISHLCRKI